MSGKSVSRAPGISRSRNVNYYHEYSNLFALGQEVLSVLTSLPRKICKPFLWPVGGTATPRWNHSPTTKNSLRAAERFPRNWNLSVLHFPSSSSGPRSLVSPGQETEAGGEGKQSWRQYQGSFFRPSGGQASLSTRGVTRPHARRLGSPIQKATALPWTQSSYLAAQAASETAGTGRQTAGGRELAQAAAVDGGKSRPVHWGRHTRPSQSLQAGGAGFICLLPISPVGLWTLQVCGDGLALHLCVSPTSGT